ncbi:MAG: aldo/keto reductase [Chloroflexi bacterium]|nr:aldo/keto reductase [Chloroflexota bacterium]
MEYRTFGRTGLKVSAMGFGTWPMSGDRYGAIVDEEAIQAIRRALDAGVNCVDTAPGYGTGHSETVTGRALKGRRDDVILVTKCGIRFNPETRIVDRDASRANILEEVDASLKRLDTDRIDVYLVHWPDPKVPFEETAAVMDEVVKAGKVRYVGVSNFTVEQMEAFQKVRPIDVIQVGYHLFDRRMEQEIFPFCKQHNIGVMGYGSLGHGLLTGAFTSDTAFDPNDWRSRGVAFGQPILKGDNFRNNIEVVNRLRREVAEPRGVPMSQIALAWVLLNPVLSVALVGSRTPEELHQNLAGVELKLTDEEIRKIDEIMRDAKGMISTFTPLRFAQDEWEPVAVEAPAT